MNEATATIEAVNERIEEAVVSKDFASLSVLYADDFVFTHGTGLVQTKHQWLDSLTSNETRFLSRQLDPPSIEFHGDTAQVTGQLHVHRQSKDGDAKYGIRYVRVYSMRTGLWQLVSHHTIAQWDA
ncbi:MAG: nuclear transport factor 2 family protein [Ignavibacteriales bacterium]|nr:nuclear transport factor 2 family protein [Ignavibacteriales bacterium]